MTEKNRRKMNGRGAEMKSFATATLGWDGWRERRRGMLEREPSERTGTDRPELLRGEWTDVFIILSSSSSSSPLKSGRVAFQGVKRRTQRRSEEGEFGEGEGEGGIAMIQQPTQLGGLCFASSSRVAAREDGVCVCQRARARPHSQCGV